MIDLNGFMSTLDFQHEKTHQHGRAYQDCLERSDEHFHPDGRPMLAPFSLVTGHLIDLAEPDFAHLTLEEFLTAAAGGLARTNRYGGQTDPAYGVARHCLLGLELVDETIAAHPDVLEWFSRELLDPAEARERLRDHVGLHFLLHDVSEGLGLCDVPYPLKRLIAPLYDPLEELMMAAVYRRLGLERPAPEVVALVKRIDYQMLCEEMWHLRGRENYRERAHHNWSDRSVWFGGESNGEYGVIGTAQTWTEQVRNHLTAVKGNT